LLNKEVIYQCAHGSDVITKMISELPDFAA